MKPYSVRSNQIYNRSLVRIVFIGYLAHPKMTMQRMKLLYSFSGTSKEIQRIVPGVDVASGITPRYPRMTKYTPILPTYLPT